MFWAWSKVRGTQIATRQTAEQLDHERREPAHGYRPQEPRPTPSQVDGGGYAGTHGRRFMVGVSGADGLFVPKGGGGTGTRNSPRRSRKVATFRPCWAVSRHGRDLPWRRTRDPYHVTVSEFMLQQTQVSRVLEYYPRFLERFPTVEHLAAARPRAVMEQWDGLGYYARARNLHALAREVVGRYDAKTPSEPDELIKLPGIGGTPGRWRASRTKPVAASIPTSRGLRRYFFGDGGRGTGDRAATTRPASRVPRPHATDLWSLAEALVPRNGKRAWRFNQGLMELGALVCVARKPKCGECPVKKGCKTGGSS
jgi:A/G-specific adenine glycosylase